MLNTLTYSNKTLHTYQVFILLALWLALPQVALTASNADPRALMVAKYRHLAASRQTGQYPIALEFATQYIGGQASTHLYLISDLAYTRFSDFLQKNVWCEALILQIHIKSCRRRENGLDIYLGSEDYAVPDDVFMFEYQMEDQELSDDYLHLAMAAQDGPLDSEHYRIELEIIPTPDGKGFIHFYYSADYGFFSRAAIGTYLATLGRNKVGFTILKTQPTGTRVYQKGMEGIIERNAMRYVLALLAYLEIKSDTQPNLRLEAGLRRWHHYTELFREQLYEMPLAEYIKIKKAEYRNQQALAAGKPIDAQWPDE